METRQRRSFTDDYKRQAVDLVALSGRSIGSVAKELGLRDSVLRRWVELRGAGREPTAASRRPTTQVTLPSADGAMEAARLRHMEAGILLSSPLMFTSSKLIGDLALAKRLPLISLFDEFPRNGGLIAYGPNLTDIFRRCVFPLRIRHF
jgi:transposase